MALLISFYDNALIYYPNIFFVASFFVSIFGIVLVSIGIMVLRKEVRRIFEKIKKNLKLKKRIEEKETKKVSFIPTVRIFLKKKKISSVYIIGFLIISIVHMIKVTFIRINMALRRIESQTDRVIKKIGKEILIKE